MPNTMYEKEFWNSGKLVAGIDEAGRGSIAGPVIAAAVLFPATLKLIPEINDSKKLTKTQRSKAFEIILDAAFDISVSLIDNNTIDELNILRATMLAMNKCASSLKTRPDCLLIDGNYFKSDEFNFKTIVKGDSISVSIAAASIVAKVFRDRIMDCYSFDYPDYFFDRNKGYGTREHFEQIEINGPCSIHRNSFLRKFRTRQLTLY